VNHATRTSYFVLFVSALVIGLSLTVFGANVEPPKALAQVGPGNTLFLPLMTTDAANVTAADDMEDAVTLDPAVFDSTIFILAPSTRPNLFVDCVDNPYFPLIPGSVYEYEAVTDEGTETIIVTVTDRTKRVSGIQATVVRDVVTLEGVLVEDTFDWFAQDKRGNVWYLGEDVSNYEDGQFVDKEGSWEAGVNGAVPGIIMLDRPFAGDIYRQEFLEGEAEDMAAVLSLNNRVSVPYGTFNNVLKTLDYNPLDGELEHKFYAPDVGLIKTVNLETNETEELISFSRDASIAGGNRCGGRDDD
jgi:hypothetical protein